MVVVGGGQGVRPKPGTEVLGYLRQGEGNNSRGSSESFLFGPDPFHACGRIKQTSIQSTPANEKKKTEKKRENK